MSENPSPEPERILLHADFSTTRHEQWEPDDGSHEHEKARRDKSRRLVQLLRDMDRTQQQTDEDGGREVAWYYYRDQIEDALGLERGALDTGERLSLDDILAHVRDQVESQGGTWPLKAPPGLSPMSSEETDA